MCHRHLPQFDYVTRCDRPHPCQVCDERDKGCPLKCAHDYFDEAQALGRVCENEVVDSRTLAAEIARALTLQHEAQEGPVFWGCSPAMADLRRQLAVLSRSPLPVLIEGETGTGKSFFAEHVLHPRSGAKGPLVVTDLSTVPGTLMPAHLFGSRRGSYTGAVEDHAGVFEQAHGGPLFLDDIA